MTKRSFNLFTLRPYQELELFGALRACKSSNRIKAICRITFNQTRMLQKARKKNALLFDHLTGIRGYACETWNEARDCFLFDVITVDFSLPAGSESEQFYIPIFETLDEAESELCCHTGEGTDAKPMDREAILGFISIPYTEFPAWLYENGFDIVGIPDGDGGRRTCHYRPLIASASMARQGQYLFVNDEVFDELVERISHGLLNADEQHRMRHTMTGVSTIFPSKLSAYMGLALSDGSSMKELKAAWIRDRVDPDNPAPDVDGMLGPDSVIVVDDAEIRDGRALFSARGPWVWTSQKDDRGTLPNKLRSPFDEPIQFPSNKKDLLIFKDILNFLAGGPSTETLLSRWEALLLDDAAQGRVPLIAETFLPLPGPDIDADSIDAKCEEAEALWKLADELGSSGNAGRMKEILPRIEALIDGCQDQRRKGRLRSAIEDFKKGEGSVKKRTLFTDSLKQEASNWRTGFPAVNRKKIARHLHLHAWYLFFAAAAQSHRPEDFENGEAVVLLEDIPRLFKDENFGEKLLALIDTERKSEGHRRRVLSVLRRDSDAKPPRGTAFFSVTKGESSPVAIAVYFGQPTRSTCRAVLTDVASMDPMSVNLTDGCGFMDPRIADDIERLALQKPKLEPQERRRFSAFIVRMPFIKGLMIRMDFRKFLEDRWSEVKGSDVPVGDIRIRDIWGRVHSLNAVRILLTRSMFKGYAYFRGDDPWQEYWNRFEKYGCSMLIAGRDSLPAGQTLHNYQFLQTEFTGEALVKRAREEARRMAELLTRKADQQDFFGRAGERVADEGYNDSDDNPCGDPDNIEEAAGASDRSGSEAMPEGDDPGDAADEEAAGKARDDASLDDTIEVFAALLERDPSLLQTRYARQQLLSSVRNRLTNTMLGRLTVEGDVRFLAPDLLFMLEYVFQRYILNNDRWRIHSDINEGTFTPDEFTPDEKAGLYGLGACYAPGENAPWRKEQGKNVALLRSPHLAVGEDTLAHPLYDKPLKVYDALFSHLDGLCQAPYAAAATMSGADYDGDRIHIVSDPAIVHIIERTARINVALLSDIARDREGIANLIQQQDDTAFWSAMEDWIDDAIPGDVEVVSPEGWADGYCPALIFGTSSGAAGAVSVASLGGSGNDVTFEDAFFRVWRLTRQQRIGEMSLLALRYANAAYSDYSGGLFNALKNALPEVPPADWDRNSSLKSLYGRWKSLCEAIRDIEGRDPALERRLELIRRWLWHWRLVTVSLDTANEIDMAKTQIQSSPHVLRASMDVDDDALGRIIEWHNPSQMYQYRHLIKKTLPRPSDSQYDEEFTRVLNESVDAILSNPFFPLDRLPVAVIRGFADAMQEAVAGGNVDPESAFAAVFPKEGRFDGSLWLPVAGYETLGKRFAGMRAREGFQMDAELKRACNAVYDPYMAFTRHRRGQDVARRSLPMLYSRCMRELMRQCGSLAEAWIKIRVLLGDGISGSGVFTEDLSALRRISELVNQNDQYEFFSRILLKEFDFEGAGKLISAQRDEDSSATAEWPDRLFSMFPGRPPAGFYAAVLARMKAIRDDQANNQWFFNDMLWAEESPGQREAVLRRHLQSWFDGLPEHARALMTASERSVYLLCELCRYEAAAFAGSAEEAPEIRTPEQLKAALLGILGSEDMLYQYLSRKDANDFLLLSLCGKAIRRAVAAGDARGKEAE